MTTTAETIHDLRTELDEARDAYDALVEAWGNLKRSIRRADLKADFSSLYDRLDAYVPDDLGDVGAGQSFGQWLDEVDAAIEAEENER